MKAEEKNSISRAKIMKAAMEEYGAYGYADASFNRICKENKLSKGLVYHYFNSKDEIYLLCVKECFDMMEKYFKANTVFYEDIQKTVEGYFRMREDFFGENKNYIQIYLSSAIGPPEHLKEQIEELGKELDAYNNDFTSKAFSKLKLRKGVTQQSVTEYFFAFNEFFDWSLRDHYGKNTVTKNKIQAHDNKMLHFYDKMLYGIAIPQSE